MTSPVAARNSQPPRPHLLPARRPGAVLLAAWSFVYVFFSNHTPFDAPNRSEPCRLS